uniref:Fido domain-containing protein n=1 Tax=Desulfovibrio sp. U5L TaxID=596152 RepID=I2PYF9_9BACT
MAMSTRKQYRLDLDRIEASLREVKDNFEALNEKLLMRREPLTDQIIGNLLEGYAYVDQLLEDRVEVFSPSGFDHILELNHLVLCGSNARVRLEYGPHLLETRHRFADGIDEIADWYERKRHKSATRRAAGVYVLSVSQPQLFLEGNHRTGTLVASYILVQEGLPPFVLTPKNAVAYFNPSTLIKYRHKEKFLDRQYYLKKYRRGLQEFLEETLDKKFRRTLRLDKADAEAKSPPTTPS